MASYIKVPSGWRAMIRRRGHPSKSRTFDTKAQAERWARMVEREMDERGITAGKNITVQAMFDRFKEEVCPTRKGEKWETDRINKLVRECKWMQLRAEEILPEHIRSYRDERLKLVSPGSVKRELGLISGVFSHAIKEGWVTLQGNPVSLVKRPSDNKPRTQRVTDAELLAIVGDWREATAPETAREFLPFVAWFAVETAMRLSEICALRPEDVADTYVVARDTKNGQDRNVALSPAARQIIDLLPSLFHVTPELIGIRWREATKAAGLQHIRFHDLRREATSRLAQRLDVMDLCKMTGHRDPRITLAVYYQPDPGEMAAKLV